MRMFLGLMLLLVGNWCGVAEAHKASDSYLTLKISQSRVEGQWDIALRDLDFAIGLDRDGNGEITWNEVRAKHADIAAYALSRLTLSADGTACPLTATQHLLDQHSDGAYEILRFNAECAGKIKALTVHYHLLFDIDPLHQGLLRLETPSGTKTAIFSPANPTQQFKLSEADKLGEFIEYVQHGVGHIWIGIDHILFLLSLLLPAVLICNAKQWRATDSFKLAFLDVLKIVTAFTLAHSITLTLATLQIISLPSRWVESAIAASVVIAALNNLFPLFQGRRWLAAFGFGLIHGFGFASVLADLGLPQSTLLLALVGFNVGVEIGQLTIVAVFLPLAFLLRKTWFYQRAIFRAGSMLIVLIAAIWLIERAFNLKLISS
jgi:hypothetical protein